jgi:hypothetical protein
MALETETKIEADPSPATGATAGSPAPNSQGAQPQDSPPAPGEAQKPKPPGSISEAMAQAKLEEPAEEAAGAKTEPQPDKAPTTEDEAEQDPEAAAPKDEQAKAGESDASNVLFDKRSEWQQAREALGKDGFGKIKPILRKVMESETRALGRLKELQPSADVVNELRTLTGDENGFNQMRQIVKTYAQDPAAAIPILEGMLADARQRGGFELSSPDLKEQAAFIEQQVAEGLIDPEAAKRLRAPIVEAEKARAKAKQSDARLNQHQAQTEQQRLQASERQVMQTINAWEANIRERNPDFGNVTDVNDAQHGVSVADQVFDALCVKRATNPNAGSRELIAEAERALKIALGRLAGPAPRNQRPITTQGSSVTAKPRPRTMREAMDGVKLES